MLVPPPVARGAYVTHARIPPPGGALTLSDWLRALISGGRYYGGLPLMFGVLFVDVSEPIVYYLYPLAMLTVNNNNEMLSTKSCLEMFKSDRLQLQFSLLTMTTRHPHCDWYIRQQHRTQPWLVGVCKQNLNVKQTRNASSEIHTNPANQACFANQSPRNDHVIGALRHRESPCKNIYSV